MKGPTWAVILVGGEGTRLRPLTHTRPKPVVPLLGRPLLAYQLALLREHGVTDVIVACRYRFDDVRTALGDGQAVGVRLRYVLEEAPLGTGGAVRNAVGRTTGPLFVLNGDVLTDADLTAMHRFHTERGAHTTIYLTRVSDPRAYGVVETAPDGRLCAFREKPTAPQEITTDTINAGIYLIHADLLSRIPPHKAVSIEHEFFPSLIAAGVPCYGWIAGAYWCDIGNVAAYRSAQFDLLTGKVRSYLPPPGVACHGNWIASDAAVQGSAVVERPSLLASGVIVAAGAQVGPFAVVGEHCRIGEQARLEKAILWERVTVGARAVLRGCVVGHDVTIGPGALIGDGVVVESGATVPEGARLG